MMLTLTTSAAGALFPVEAPKPDAPMATGNLEIGDNKTKVLVAAFERISEKGVRYLNLKIQDADRTWTFWGKLFTTSDKKTEKSPDLTGFITLNEEKTQRLHVAGWNRNASKTGKPFISLQVSPDREKNNLRVDEAEEIQT